MMNKLVDVLREVFWLKKKSKKRPARPKKSASKRKKPLNPAKPTKPSKPTKPPKPSKPALDPNLVRVGEITHYFDRIKVGVVKITQGTVLIGDRLSIAAKSGVFVQKVWSMQIESKDVKIAKKGQLIGLKIDKAAAVGDIVYK